MKPSKWILFLGFTFGLFFAAVAWCDLSESELADILIKAHKADQKIPVLSTQKPNLDVQTAYRVQKAYVDQRLAQDQIVGFKAGFCTEAAQKKYGLNAPAAGVLFASGKKMGFPLIEKSAFKNLLVETEIGFLMGKSITQPLKDTRPASASSLSVFVLPGPLPLVLDPLDPWHLKRPVAK